MTVIKRTGTEDYFFISRRSPGDPRVVSPSEEEFFSRVTKKTENFVRKTRSSPTRTCAEYFVSVDAPADPEDNMSLFGFSW